MTATEKHNAMVARMLSNLVSIQDRQSSASVRLMTATEEHNAQVARILADLVNSRDRESAALANSRDEESAWETLFPMGKVGLESDLVSFDRNPLSLDIALNVREYGGEIRNAGGYQDVVALPDSTAHTLFAGYWIQGVGAGSRKSIILALSDTTFQQYDGTSWTNIPKTGFLNDGQQRRFTGGWLVGGLTIASTRSVFTHRPGVDTDALPMVFNIGTGETWADLAKNANVFRPYRNFMFAGLVSEHEPAADPPADFQYPTRVRWSDPVEPGDVPKNWVETEGEQLAGSVELAETPGYIVEMIPLRDKLIIYKSDAIYTCEFVGGDFIFDFELLTDKFGLQTWDTVVEHGGKHWVLGNDDIYVTDGNTVVSAIYGKVKERFVAERSPARVLYNFVNFDPFHEEMVFAFTRADQPGAELFPKSALVINVRSGTIWWREWDVQIAHQITTVDVLAQGSTRERLYGIDRVRGYLVEMERTPTRNGMVFWFEIERKGLFWQPGTDWNQIDQVKPGFSGQECSMQLGTQTAPDDAVVWGVDDPFDPESMYKSDIRANGNMIAYRIYGNTEADWKLSSMSFLMQTSGKRE